MAWKQTKRLVSLLLTLMMTIGFAPNVPALADEGVTQGSTISGTVRVYLSSIGSKTSVDLTTDGSYSIDGDTSRAIARGTQLSVRNSGGTLTLTMNGQSQAMGSRFKLRRHQTSGNNGVRIAQARYPQNLYPGDIELIAKGGNVQIVVHVYMEDYMMGVLPYEMDNSFPLEALKAQAVAARTYALKKMSAQASTYDLVDTTSDQVYNGTPSGNARCVQAVQETSGVVGTVNGEYMASYYTASNGGQTEAVANAWGSGAYSYLQVKDDPFDLRNGASVAKSVTFYKNGTTSVSALTQLLRTEAAAQLSVSSVTIEGITSVTPHTPKYDAPSRVYTKVDVGLRLAGYGNVTVTLDYFSQVESLCSMSINVLKNETLDVTETDSAFKLTARRYGHGVGMSQRGAQQMGNEGYTYDQILEFYYPGLRRTKYTLTRTILPAMDGTQTQPDEPVADAKMAIVSLSNPLDHLNLRGTASATGSILAHIPHGTQITVLESGSAWSRVQYGTLSGYVSSAYLRFVDDKGEEAPSVSGGKGTATVVLSDDSQALNLRAAPTTGAAIVAKLRHGTEMTVLERYASWTYVRVGTHTGYVMNDYITYHADGAAPDEGGQMKPDMGDSTGSDSATVALDSADSRLNLRADRSLSAEVLLRLSNGAKVTVLERGAQWCKVTFADVTGYCATDYLKFDGDASGNGAADESETAARLTAIVLPEDGLNLRAAASVSSAILMTLPQGTMLSVTGDGENGMLAVRLGGLAGYVSGDYVYVTTEAVSSGAVQQQPTSAPTPAPTAAPEAAKGTAMVVASSGLKLRSGPSRSDSSLMTMPYGTNVTVLGDAVDGFVPVRCGETEGYASASYLLMQESNTPIPIPTATPNLPATGRTGTITAPNGLNLRTQPAQSGGVIATLGYGVNVTIAGEKIDGFYPVRVGTLFGYVSASYIQLGEAQQGTTQPQTVTPEPTQTPQAVVPLAGDRVIVQSDNGLNLRAQPNAGSEIAYVLPYGTVLEVIGVTDSGFLFVRWGGYMGYVAKDYVTVLSAE